MSTACAEILRDPGGPGRPGRWLRRGLRSSSQCNFAGRPVRPRARSAFWPAPHRILLQFCLTADLRGARGARRFLMFRSDTTSRADLGSSTAPARLDRRPISVACPTPWRRKSLMECTRGPTHHAGSVLLPRNGYARDPHGPSCAMAAAPSPARVLRDPTLSSSSSTADYSRANGPRSSSWRPRHLPLRNEGTGDAANSFLRQGAAGLGYPSSVSGVRSDRLRHGGASAKRARSPRNIGAVHTDFIRIDGLSLGRYRSRGKSSFRPRSMVPYHLAIRLST